MRIPFLDDFVTITTYPDTTRHIEVAENVPELVFAQASDALHLVETLAVRDTVRRNFGRDLQIFCPLLPYSRDDRKRTPGSVMMLDYAIELAKRANVVIADPHSYVSEAVPHIRQEEFVNLLPIPDDAAIVIPDEGAAKKAYTWIKPTHSVVQAYKTRDPHTGRLSGFGARPLTDQTLQKALEGREVWVYDDICDGGGTFIGLVDSVLEFYRPASIHLAVSHAIFSKGFDSLLKRFDTISMFDNAPEDFEPRNPATSAIHIYEYPDLTTSTIW